MMDPFSIQSAQPMQQPTMVPMVPAAAAPQQSPDYMKMLMKLAMHKFAQRQGRQQNPSPVGTPPQEQVLLAPQDEGAIRDENKSAYDFTNF